MHDRRRILAIDGGGVRGIIPALALEALEAATGRPARESFDFLAGTSTGAVIAGAVAAGIPAERIVSLYRRRGPELFQRRSSASCAEWLSGTSTRSRRCEG